MFAKSRWRRRQAITAYLLLSPGILYFLLYFFYPIIIEFWASFHTGLPLIGEAKFSGLDNYVDAFTSRTVRHSFVITIIFSVVSVVLTLVISVSLASILSGPAKKNTAIRAIIFFPYITSFVIVALMWKSILDPYTGILNGILLQFGLPTQDWLNNPDTALITMICIVVWKDIGYATLIYIAGIQGISGDLYEAAKLDGASPRQQFRLITLPLLAPTTLFLAVVGMIGHLQDLSAPYLLTGGGPANATRLYSLNVYKAAFEQLNIGYASALSFLMFIAILIITYFQFKLLNREVSY